jgi:hypothetical protein
MLYWHIRAAEIGSPMEPQGTLRDSNNNAVAVGSTLPSAALTYTANASPNQRDRFIFEVKDDGGTANGSRDTSQPATVTLNIVNSVDPNDIVCPAGMGWQHWIARDEQLPFTVRLENASAATAPAQEAIIRTTLDSDLDPSTFQFGNIGIGGGLITIPAGNHSFDTRIELASPEGRTLQLDVNHATKSASKIRQWQT